MGNLHAHHDSSVLPGMRTRDYTMPKQSVNSVHSERAKKKKEVKPITLYLVLLYK